MRSKTKKSISILLGIVTFFLLLIFKGIFSNPAYAFLSSLDACADNPECVAVLGSELSPAISAPTGAGFGASTLSTTTKAGATTSAVESVARVAIVVGSRISKILAWHYWNQTHNEQAQNKAQEIYCATNPLDLVCGVQGQPGVLYNYKFHETVHYRRSGYPDKFVTHHYRSWQPVPGPITSLANQYPGGYYGGSYPPSSEYVGWIHLNDGGGDNQTRGVVYESSTGDPMSWDDYLYIYDNNNAEKGWISDLVRADGVPNDSHPVDWKDWPQDKRDAAVKLLNNSDWQDLIQSMPEGGTLNPGDTINAPTIVIPDIDGVKKQPGPYSIPDDYPNSVPSPSPDPSPSPSPDPSPSPSPDPSSNPSPSPSPDPSSSPSPSPSPDPSPSPSPDPSPSPSPDPSPSPSPSPTPKPKCDYTIDENHIFYPDVRNGRITGFHSTARAGDPHEDEGYYYWITEPAEYEADYEPFTAEFGIPQRSSLGIKTSSFFPILLDDIKVLEIIGEAYVESKCPAYGIWAASVKNPLINGESIIIEGSVTNHRITTAYPYAPGLSND